MVARKTKTPAEPPLDEAEAGVGSTGRPRPDLPKPYGDWSWMQGMDGESSSASEGAVWRTRRFRHTIAGFGAMLLFLGMAGCEVLSGNFAGWRMLSDADARLAEDVAMAVYVSPPDYAFTGAGYVLLIDQTGGVSAIQTAGMDVATLVWTEKGLFFSDVDRDYLLDAEGLKAWDSPKAEVQVAAYPKPDGGGYVGVYNVGFGDVEAGDAGYIQQVVDTTEERRSERYDVAGFTTLTAWCDGEIYGLSEIVEPYLSVAVDAGAKKREVPPFWPDMMSRLYPKPASLVDGFRSVSNNGVGGYARNGICRDGTVMSVSIGQNDPTTVVTWPVDGDRSERVLVGPAGEALNLEPDTAFLGYVADWSASASELVWFGGDGVVRSTDIQTGRTQELWNADVDLHSSYNNIQFQNQVVYVFDAIAGQDSADRVMRLRAHDLVTGVTDEILTVQPRFELMARGSTVVQRGIAVRPG